ncbi:hypothetical protein BBJ28_00017152 [Nothophytophthora sp. Chile5]|nr:hypothetical protein BBJ28_00017152 [Nothophytophthora sp. Chile5]
MLARYLCILDATKKIAAVEDYVPRVARHRQIEKLFVYLKMLDSMTVVLQADKRTLADARALFDSVIKTCPDTGNSLRSTAKIVHTQALENAVVEVINVTSLTIAEAETVSDFRFGAGPATKKRKATEDDFARSVFRDGKKAPVDSLWVPVLVSSQEPRRTTEPTPLRSIKRTPAKAVTGAALVEARKGKKKLVRHLAAGSAPPKKDTLGGGHGSESTSEDKAAPPPVQKARKAPAAAKTRAR